MLKMRIFLKNNKHFRLPASIVTLAYYYKFVEYVSSTKFVLLLSKKNKVTAHEVSVTITHRTLDHRVSSSMLFELITRFWVRFSFAAARLSVHIYVVVTRSERRLIFFHSYSVHVFQKLTPAPGMTPDYTKLIDFCSCLTPVGNRVECKYTLISQKYCD